MELATKGAIRVAEQERREGNRTILQPSHSSVDCNLVAGTLNRQPLKKKGNEKKKKVIEEGGLVMANANPYGDKKVQAHVKEIADRTAEARSYFNLPETEKVRFWNRRWSIFAGY